MFGKSISEEKNYQETTLIIGLLGILILRDIFCIGINKFIITGFVAMLMLNACIASIIAMLSFCFPLFCGLPGKYIMIIALTLILFRTQFKLRPQQFFCMVFVVLMELIASIWYNSPEWMEIVGYMLFAIIMFWMLWTEEDLDHKKCLSYFLLGDASLCGIITAAGIKAAPSDWINMFSAGMFRFGDTQLDEMGNGMTLWLNPNGLAYFSVVGITIALVLLEDQNKKGKSRYAIMLAICAVTGFLTQSRSWIVCMAILLVFYAAGKMTSFRSFLGFLFVLGVVAFGAYRYFINHPMLLLGLSTRFTASDMLSADGRTILFQQYMEAFFSNIRFEILGTGIMQYRMVTGIIQNGMHNSTQQLLVCYGIPGFLFMIYHLFAPIRKALRGFKFNIIYWLPVLSVILFTQTIQFVHPYTYMPPFAVASYALLLGRETSQGNGHIFNILNKEDRIKQ